MFDVLVYESNELLFSKYVQEQEHFVILTAFITPLRSFVTELVHQVNEINEIDMINKIEKQNREMWRGS